MFTEAWRRAAIAGRAWRRDVVPGACICTQPSSSSGSASKIPRSTTCGSSISSSISYTGAAVTSASAKAFRASSRVCVAIQPPTTASTSSRCLTREELSLKRGSRIMSARPTNRRGVRPCLHRPERAIRLPSAFDRHCRGRSYSIRSPRFDLAGNVYAAASGPKIEMIGSKSDRSMTCPGASPRSRARTFTVARPRRGRQSYRRGSGAPAHGPQTRCAPRIPT